MFLRNTEATAVTFTLLIGRLFLTTGIARLFAAGGAPEYRFALFFSGAVSTILGLIVLFNLYDASYALIGVLIGIDVLAEGLAMMIVGRTTITVVDAPDQLAAFDPGGLRTGVDSRRKSQDNESPARLSLDHWQRAPLPGVGGKSRGEEVARWRRSECWSRWDTRHHVTPIRTS